MHYKGDVCVIAQLLNQEFLLSALDALEPELRAAAGDGDARRGGEPHPADEVEQEEFVEALAEVRRVQSDLTDGQDGGNDIAYMPREHVLALLQSTIEQYVATKLPEEAVAYDAPPDDRRSVGDEPLVTDAWLAELPPETSAEGRRWFGPFETAKPLIFSDPLWLSAGLAMGIRFFRRRHPFARAPAPPRRLAAQARVVLVGDWGSGLPRAQSVARAMRRQIEIGRERRVPVDVVHLGDVYYSGYEWEYEKRFLPYWPVEAAEAGEIRSWTLNGNHDMYAGGYGYHETCLADPRFAAQGRSSWFSLANDDWQVLGLDTAWEDAGLQDPQASWLGLQAGSSDRKLLLLSHHQLFSAYSHPSPKLERKIRPLIDANRIKAWFWGHEHGCVLYRSHMGVEFARCVGNGGVPEYMPRVATDPYAEPAFWELRERRPLAGQPWNTFGFAVLDFNGPKIDVTYFDEDGNVVRQEQIA
jgi:hypothetical protein